MPGRGQQETAAPEPTIAATLAAGHDIQPDSAQPTPRRCSGSSHCPISKRGPAVLAEGGDANRRNPVEWTRQGLDSFSAHEVSFLRLIPDPGQLTIDIGAAEGGFSRELLARGVG